MLRATRRLLRPGGRTVFTTIHLAPGLTGGRRRRAVDAGPRAVSSRLDQATMLERAGFTDVEQVDVSTRYVDTVRRWIQAWEADVDALAALEAPGEFVQRVENHRVQLTAAEQGLLRRSLVAATRPARRS